MIDRHHPHTWPRHVARAVVGVAVLRTVRLREWCPKMVTQPLSRRRRTWQIDNAICRHRRHCLTIWWLSSPMVDFLFVGGFIRTECLPLLSVSVFLLVAYESPYTDFALGQVRAASNTKRDRAAGYNFYTVGWMMRLLIWSLELRVTIAGRTSSLYLYIQIWHIASGFPCFALFETNLNTFSVNIYN